MGSSLNIIKTVLDPFGTGQALLDKPKMPKVTPPRTIDQREADRLAEEKAKRRRQRASSGFGHSDTILTNGLLGQPSGTLAPKTLLGS